MVPERYVESGGPSENVWESDLGPMGLGPTYKDPGADPEGVVWGGAHARRGYRIS